MLAFIHFSLQSRLPAQDIFWCETKAAATILTINNDSEGKNGGRPNGGHRMHAHTAVRTTRKEMCNLKSVILGSANINASHYYARIRLYNAANRAVWKPRYRRTVEWWKWSGATPTSRRRSDQREKKAHRAEENSHPRHCVIRVGTVPTYICTCEIVNFCLARSVLYFRSCTCFFFGIQIKYLISGYTVSVTFTFRFYDDCMKYIIILFFCRHSVRVDFNGRCVADAMLLCHQNVLRICVSCVRN